MVLPFQAVTVLNANDYATPIFQPLNAQTDTMYDAGFTGFLIDKNMSTIKVDTIATRTGSGNITASNTINNTSATLSGTLAVTGATTTCLQLHQLVGMT